MLTVDQLLAFRRVGGARISPDGSAVVYEVGAALAGADADLGTHLWLAETAGAAPRQLTYGGGKDTDPAWSPDGGTIAFLSDRDGEGKRLFLLPRDGGEAQPLATGDGAIKGFSWSPDGTTIAFLRTDPEPEASRGVTNAPIVVEEAFALTIGSGRSTLGERRGAARRPMRTAQIWEFAWLRRQRGDSPSSSPMRRPRPTWYGCRLARLDLATGTLTTLYQPPTGRQVARPVPAPDGRAVACVICAWSDPGMSGGDLWLVPGAPAEGGEPRNLTAGATFSVNMVTWQPDGRNLLAHAYDDLGTSLGLIAAEGAGGWQRLWHGPYHLGFDGIYPADDSRTFAAPRSAGREPTDLWLGTIADGAVAWRALADTHGERRAALTADFTAARWTAPDGLELHGLLLRPPAATGPVPLVTIVHGGPTGAVSHSFSDRGLSALAPLLAARGIATFLPNYRGSNGRGVPFAEANHRDMGGGDWADIVAGIDRLVADGIADPDRLGLAGWSYGGYMTMWGVTQTARFRAAVAGCGDRQLALLPRGERSARLGRALLRGRSPRPAGDLCRALPDLRGPSRRHADPRPARAGRPGRATGSGTRVLPRAEGSGRRDATRPLPRAPATAPHEPHQIRDVIERSLDWLTDAPPRLTPGDDAHTVCSRAPRPDRATGPPLNLAGLWCQFVMPPFARQRG